MEIERSRVPGIISYIWKIVNKRHEPMKTSRIVYSQPHITNALKEVFAFVSRILQWLLWGLSIASSGPIGYTMRASSSI